MKRTDTKNGKRVTRPVKPSSKRAPVIKRPKRESMNDVIQRGLDQRSFI